MLLMLIVLLTTTPVFPNIFLSMTQAEDDNICELAGINGQHTQDL